MENLTQTTGRLIGNEAIRRFYLRIPEEKRIIGLAQRSEETWLTSEYASYTLMTGGRVSFYFF